MYTENHGVRMPLWAKAMRIIALAICGLTLFKLVQGNMGILILLGCGIPFILFGLWHTYKVDRR